MFLSGFMQARKTCELGRELLNIETVRWTKRCLHKEGLRYLWLVLYEWVCGRPCGHVSLCPCGHRGVVEAGHRDTQDTRRDRSATQQLEPTKDSKCFSVVASHWITWLVKAINQRYQWGRKVLAISQLGTFHTAAVRLFSSSRSFTKCLGAWKLAILILVMACMHWRKAMTYVRWKSRCERHDNAALARKGRDLLSCNAFSSFPAWYRLRSIHCLFFGHQQECHLLAVSCLRTYIQSMHYIYMFQHAAWTN